MGPTSPRSATMPIKVMAASIATGAAISSFGGRTSSERTAASFSTKDMLPRVVSRVGLPKFFIGELFDQSKGL